MFISAPYPYDEGNCMCQTWYVYLEVHNFAASAAAAAQTCLGSNTNPASRPHFLLLL